MFRSWGTVSLFLLLAGFCLVTVAAEKKTSKSTKSSTTAKAESKEADEPQLSGRLPRYFAALVDDKQRQEVYEIQASYRERIEELEAELAELEAAQMKEIEGVLTTTQRKKLSEMREDDDSSRSKTASRSTSSSSKKSTSAKPTSSRSSSSRSSSSKKSTKK